MARQVIFRQRDESFPDVLAGGLRGFAQGRLLRRQEETQGLQNAFLRAQTEKLGRPGLAELLLGNPEIAQKIPELASTFIDRFSGNQGGRNSGLKTGGGTPQFSQEDIAEIMEELRLRRVARNG